MWLLMAITNTTFIPNEAGLAQLLESRTGDLGLWLQFKVEQVEQLARSQCPKDSGELADSHESDVDGPPLRGQVSAGNDQVDYAVYVHEGTGPHPIDATNAPLLVFPSRSSGTMVFTPHVDHPGNRAQPWLWEALRDSIVV